MTRVAGIDSSTQSCKVTVRDAKTGARIREGRASHPAETIVDPEAWWLALGRAVSRAGGLDDVSAIAVAGQQHTPVFLDARGTPSARSPLWNDLGSRDQTVALNRELGSNEWIRRTGLPITLSDTVVKARWLRDTDPVAAARTAAVAVVHDWLTWRLRGFGGRGAVDELTTDRSEASGTGYWSDETGLYCGDLFELAFGRTAVLPKVLGPLERAGATGRGIPGIPSGIPLAVGAGDNAAAALALGLDDGDAVMSIGTSGVVYARSSHPTRDYGGYVCSYADATGGHLPLAATLNAARNFDIGSRVLGCTHEGFSELALAGTPAAGGLTLLPYFEGERTPHLPAASGSLHGISLDNFTRENLARAIVEGTLASQVVMVEALRGAGVEPRRLVLIGGAARSAAVRAILPRLTDLPITVPEPDEYVAMGAAAQAAAALSGGFPRWRTGAIRLPDVPSDTRVAERQELAREKAGYSGLS